jgi:GNAT superfamily N-acetyltransferase
MSGIVIREVTEPDFARIREISTAAWKPVYEWRRRLLGDALFEAVFGTGHPGKGEEVEAQCRRRPDCARVAELDGRVVGFVTWRLDSPIAGCGEIGNNAVDPEAQRRGVGAAMHAWLLDHFRAAGMRAAMVVTGLDEAHGPARRAYEKAGFTKDAGLPFVRYVMPLGEG